MARITQFLFVLLFIFLFSSTCTYHHIHFTNLPQFFSKVTQDVSNDDVDKNQNEPNDDNIAKDEDDEPRGADRNEKEQIIMRDKLVACAVLSRHVFSGLSDELTAVLRQASVDDSQKLYKKMIGDFMLHCFFTIKTEETERMFDDMREKRFEVDQWQHLHNFNLEKYRGEGVDMDLSPEQEQLVNWVEEFDKQMKEKYGDQGQGDGYEERKPVDLEPKLFGISIKGLATDSLAFRILYLLVIAGIIGGVFFYGSLNIHSNKYYINI